MEQPKGSLFEQYNYCDLFLYHLVNQQRVSSTIPTQMLSQNSTFSSFTYMCEINIMVDNIISNIYISILF